MPRRGTFATQGNLMVLVFDAAPGVVVRTNNIGGNSDVGLFIGPAATLTPTATRTSIR